eukprot:Mycagemm_TRINITY_DN10252_c0_g2::TRINITY_DN10252_c0_g2_i1::g.4067::m.4067 type:complete len:259 gc:universal TRINITY_DN10252_c0_g2_i1:1483-707(-)
MHRTHSRCTLSFALQWRRHVVGGGRGQDSGSVLELLAVRVDRHARVVHELARDEHARESRADLLLQVSPQGTRAVDGIVGRVQDKRDGLWAEIDRDLTLRESLRDAGQLQVHDVAEVVVRERVEDDDVVEAIEELWPKVGLHNCHDLVNYLLRQLATLSVELHNLGVLLRLQVLEQVLGTEVARHDDHHVAKVHGPALPVGEAAVIQHLQQDVPDLRVGFLHFVKEKNSVGFTSDGLCELTALVVTDVARGRANETRD